MVIDSLSLHWRRTTSLSRRHKSECIECLPHWKRPRPMPTVLLCPKILLLFSTSQHAKRTFISLARTTALAVVSYTHCDLEHAVAPKTSMNTSHHHQYTYQSLSISNKRPLSTARLLPDPERQPVATPSPPRLLSVYTASTEPPPLLILHHYHYRSPFLLSSCNLYTPSSLHGLET